MTECHWCEKDRDDGEWLGDGWAFVCRPCIRDMAAYKSDVLWQLHVAKEVNEIIDDPAAFRADISEALRSVFEEHGVAPDSVPDDWEVRE